MLVIRPPNNPAIKKGNPLPSPKADAKNKPKITFPFAAAIDKTSNNGAAEVPRVNNTPYKNEPPIPGLLKASS